VPFWEARLGEGHRITAIGGSDCHQPDEHPTRAPAVGSPTTAVFAESLGERAILDGVRAGRVFIDVEGVAGRALELTARCGAAAAAMGEQLAAPAGAAVACTLHVTGLAGARLDVVVDGRHGAALEGATLASDDAVATFLLTSDGARHWIRADVRSADDARTLLIGNPIYLNG
jgi:hypothetical protein